MFNEIHQAKVAKLNESEQTLLKGLTAVARIMARKHNLAFRKIIPVEFELWGRCNADGIIELAFYKHLNGCNGMQERWSIIKSELLRTLGHELAHLTVPNHTAAFWSLCNQYIREISSMTGIRIKPEQNVYRR